MINQINTDSSIKNTTYRTNNLCKVGFGFGVASIFLGWLGIIPMIGVIISLVALIKHNKLADKGLWMGISGFIINLLYLVANAYSNGNIG